MHEYVATNEECKRKHGHMYFRFPNPLTFSRLMEGDFGSMKSNLDRLRADLDNIEPLHIEALTEIKRNNTLLIDERIGTVAGESERYLGMDMWADYSVSVSRDALLYSEIFTVSI